MKRNELYTGKFGASLADEESGIAKRNELYTGKFGASLADEEDVIHNSA